MEYYRLEDVPRVLRISDPPVIASYYHALVSECGTGKRRAIFCIQESIPRDRLAHKDFARELEEIFKFPFVISCLERGTMFINGTSIVLRRETLAASDECRREIADLVTSDSDYKNHEVVFR